MIRLANPQVVKKNLVQLIVVVLTRVNEFMIGVLIQFMHDASQPNDLRASPQYGHDFQTLRHSFSICCKVGISELLFERFKANKRPLKRLLNRQEMSV